MLKNMIGVISVLFKQSFFRIYTKNILSTFNIRVPGSFSSRGPHTRVMMGAKFLLKTNSIQYACIVNGAWSAVPGAGQFSGGRYCTCQASGGLSRDKPPFETSEK